MKPDSARRHNGALMVVSPSLTSSRCGGRTRHPPVQEALCGPVRFNRYLDGTPRAHVLSTLTVEVCSVNREPTGTTERSVPPVTFAQAGTLIVYQGALPGASPASSVARPATGHRGPVGEHPAALTCGAEGHECSLADGRVTATTPRGQASERLPAQTMTGTQRCEDVTVSPVQQSSSVSVHPARWGAEYLNADTILRSD